MTQPASSCFIWGPPSVLHRLCECLPHSENSTPNPRSKSWSHGSAERNSVINQVWVSRSHLQPSKESASLEVGLRMRMNGLPRKNRMLYENQPEDIWLDAVQAKPRCPLQEDSQNESNTLKILLCLPKHTPNLFSPRLLPFFSPLNFCFEKLQTSTINTHIPLIKINQLLTCCHTCFISVSFSYEPLKSCRYHYTSPQNISACVILLPH